MSLRSFAAAIGLCIFGTSPIAQAVNLTADGIGEVAVAPHFSTQDGWLTALNITNTRNVPIAVRVLIREGLNGRVVSSFIVALSAFDVYTAVLKRSQSNPRASVLVGVDQTKNGNPTCTIPRSYNDGTENPLSTQGFTRQEFLLQSVGVVGVDTEATVGSIPLVGQPVVDLLTFGENDDGGPQGVERLREGQIEFIEMGFALAQDPTMTGYLGSFRPVYDNTNGTVVFDDNGLPVINEIYIGNAIEAHDCRAVELAFSGETRRLGGGEPGDALAPTGEIRRILETARQFGEPINALKFNVRMLKPSNGIEFGVPGETWANFYNPGDLDISIGGEQLLLDALLLSNNSLLDAGIDLSPITDLGTLSLREILELVIADQGVAGGVLYPLLDGVINGATPIANADPTGTIAALLGLLDNNTPGTPPASTCSTTTSDLTDACVRPDNNRACGVTRGDQRISTYMDWRPDGVGPTVGLLQALNSVLVNATNTLTAGALVNGLRALGINLDNNVDVENLTACRNLITRQTFPSFLEPSLNDAYPARAVMFDRAQNSLRTLVPAFSTPTGYNLPEDKRGIDALSLTIQRATALNEWEFNDGSRTEWVLGMPTKPYYVDGTSENAELALIKPGVYSAISPRANSELLESPLGGGLAEATSRPESLLSSTISVGTPLGVGASVTEPEREPYPPFREPFGPDAEDPSLIGLIGNILGINNPARSTARSCNSADGALYDRAEQTYLTPDDTAATTNGIPLLSSLYIPALLGTPKPQFTTSLCYNTNLVNFGGVEIASGSGADDVFPESTIPFPAPTTSQFTDKSTSGWMNYTFGYLPDSDSRPRIDVLDAAGLASNPFDIVIASISESPVSQNAIPAFDIVGNCAATNTCQLYLVTGLPVIGYVTKMRDFGNAVGRNYASAIPHSYHRLFRPAP